MNSVIPDELRHSRVGGNPSFILVWETLMTKSSQPNVHVPQGVQLPADPIADETTRRDYNSLMMLH